jgi:hypothetical protein
VGRFFVSHVLLKAGLIAGKNRKDGSVADQDWDAEPEREDNGFSCSTLMFPTSFTSAHIIN